MKNLIICLPTEYRGYVIEKETEGWPLKYGGPIRYYNPNGEVYHNAATVAEAVEAIEEGVSDYLGEGEAWAGGFADNH